MHCYFLSAIRGWVIPNIQDYKAVNVKQYVRKIEICSGVSLYNYVSSYPLYPQPYHP